MWECNTGIDCSECIGGCESNLEYSHERSSIEDYMSDYNIVDIPNEPRVESRSRGRWDFVRMVRDGHTIDRRYFHVDCDAITTREGYCVLCGTPSPLLWTM